MSNTIHFLPVLLSISRNPVTAVGLPLALGTLSGSATAKVVRGRWYQNLLVPPGRPPRQVFPIVWSLLYLSMGYASHLAVKALDAADSPTSRSALLKGILLYYAQLGLNLLWSPLFFKAKKTGLALIDSVLLTASAYCMTDLLHGPTGSKTTPFLLPYCAWLTFATYLNGGIWWLNHGRPVRRED
ncbi:putative tspO/MBR family protein [Lyophyllum shimeji]|uniref:TspO/MBR family protein n=1 Tax=Lyophyllum shimeji TaxID=47721 RepID=A0A9P3UI87_LYOSH|nr:putative tspO/MBR family protein [Lyophyllum shimeji]